MFVLLHPDPSVLIIRHNCQMPNRLTNYKSQTTSRDDVVSNGNGLEDYEMTQKVLNYKARKAKNQRRYYQKYVRLQVVYLLLSGSCSAPVGTRVCSKKRDAKDRPSEQHDISITSFYKDYRNRLLAKDVPWMRISDHEHLTSTGIGIHTPTLIPIFDTVFSWLLSSRLFKHFWVSPDPACILCQFMWNCIETYTGFEGVDF